MDLTRAMTRARARALTKALARALIRALTKALTRALTIALTSDLTSALPRDLVGRSFFCYGVGVLSRPRCHGPRPGPCRSSSKSKRCDKFRASRSLFFCEQASAMPPTRA